VLAAGLRKALAIAEKYKDVRRIAHFGWVGALCTAVSAAIFLLASRWIHYQAANVLAWACGVAVGFTLNRRITFQIRGGAGVVRQAAMFLLGSGGQLLVSTLCYWWLVEQARLSLLVALPINIAVTSLVTYSWMRVVVFR
jgi:putative flippase GtrA